MYSQPFVEPGDLAWHPTEPGVERQVLAYSPELMMVRVRFSAGAVGSLHQHPHRQVSYVAEGTFEVQIAGERRVLGPGGSFIVEPDVMHGVAARTAGMLIDVFTPARGEFVEG